MPFSIEVWGDRALFSRPGFCTERVSYDVITPSAAVGIIESVYWHPGLKYSIDRIRVCNPIRFFCAKSDEVGVMSNLSNVKRVMSAGAGTEAKMKDDIPYCSCQLLQDVRYIIDFHFIITKMAAPEDSPGKFSDIIRRRIEKGQAFRQPFLGYREFMAFFGPVNEIPPCPPELKGRLDLGFMHHSVNYRNPSHITHRIFRAVLEDGVLTVPPVGSKEVTAQLSRTVPLTASG